MTIFPLFSGGFKASKRRCCVSGHLSAAHNGRKSATIFCATIHSAATLRRAGRGRAAAGCARLLYSLFCGNLKPGSRQRHTTPHSLRRVCQFIDVTAWSQQAPWESGMFSTSTHILIFIFASFIHRVDNLKPRPHLPLCC